MADEFYGENPIVLTVLSSPAPTSSVFTVNSATDLRVDQYFNVKVGGNFERGRILSIASDQITTYDPLTAPPDTPGEVRSTRQLITTSKENSKGVYNADDVADLKTVNTTYAPNGLKYMMQDTGLIYQFDPASSAEENLYSVVEPNSSIGRWLLLSPTSTSGAIGTGFGNLNEMFEFLQERIYDLEEKMKLVSLSTREGIKIHSQAVRLFRGENETVAAGGFAMFAVYCDSLFNSNQNNLVFYDDGQSTVKMQLDQELPFTFGPGDFVSCEPVPVSDQLYNFLENTSFQGRTSEYQHDFDTTPDNENDGRHDDLIWKTYVATPNAFYLKVYNHGSASRNISEAIFNLTIISIGSKDYGA